MSSGEDRSAVELDGTDSGTLNVTNEHPMDVVYDIVEELQDSEGWVGLDTLIIHAATRGLPKEAAEEAIENWVILSGLVRDSTSQKLKILLPPAG